MGNTTALHVVEMWDGWLIATLHDPAVIRKILAHLGRSPSEQGPGPAAPAPAAAAP